MSVTTTLSQLRISLFVLLLSLGFNSIAQQRIGADLSTRMDNLMLTVHYQKVLKNHVLYSGGVFAGSNGRVFFNNDTIDLYTGAPIKSPFSAANQTITDATGSYSLLDYNYSSKSLGLQLGLGYFFEFDVKHGLRTNLNTSVGFVNSKLSGFYRSRENFSEVFTTHNTRYFTGSISLEAYHTIRLSGRFTFNYGLKIPYHFTLDKARFNPVLQKDLLNGIEPQISLGFTRVIGKCD